MTNPIVTIITTCLNVEDSITNAIESVVNQNFERLEHIIVDGGSTDATLERITGYPKLIIASQPDGGIYDGMNRGLQRAKGEIVGFLHGDDRLAPDAVAKAVARFEAEDDPDIVSGSAEVIDIVNGSILALLRPRAAPSYFGLTFGVPALNARFFKRKSLSNLGSFSLRFPYAADRELLMRALDAGLRFGHINDVIYIYGAHTRSATLAGDRRSAVKLWREHITLAADLFCSEAGSHERRGACRLWHALEGAKLCTHLACTGPVTNLESVIAELFQQDPGWALRLPAAMLQWRRWRGQHSDS